MTNKLILLALVFGIIWLIYNEFTGNNRYIHNLVSEIIGA